MAAGMWSVWSWWIVMAFGYAHASAWPLSADDENCHGPKGHLSFLQRRGEVLETREALQTDEALEIHEALETDDALEADSVIQKVCPAVSGLCQNQIKYPESAKLLYRKTCNNRFCTWKCGQSCTNKCCTWDCGQQKCLTNFCVWWSKKCKWGVCVKIPHSGFSKKHCGETCVNVPCTGCSASRCGRACTDNICSGFSKSKCGQWCEDVPDKLDIQYKTTSPCSLVNISPLVEKAAALCPCLSTIEGTLEKIGDSPEPDALSAEGIAAAADLSSCLISASFDVQNNRDDMLGNLGDDFIIFGPDIDVSFYQQMLTGVVACAAGGACDVLLGSLKKFVIDMKDSVRDGLSRFLEHFLIQKLIGPVQEKLHVLIGEAVGVPQSIQDHLDQCVASASAEVQEKVSALHNIVDALKSFPDEVSDLAASLQRVQGKVGEAMDAVRDAIDAVDPSLQKIVQEAVQEGKVPLMSVVQVFLDLKKLPEAIHEAAGLKTNISDLKAKAEDLRDMVDEVKVLSSEAFPPCLPRNLLDSLDVMEAVAGLQAVAEDALDLFVSSGLQLDHLTLQGGVVSYNQWADLSADLPCTRQKTLKFSIQGFTKISLPYPEPYTCRWAKRVPFPNEHVPYLRIKIKKSALL